MPLNFTITPHKLDFLFEAGTSRGVLRQKATWFIKVFDTDKPQVQGWGEAGPLQGLSIDDVPDFEAQLRQALALLHIPKVPNNKEEIFKIAGKLPVSLPSVKFGVETALLDLLHGGKRKLFESTFYNAQTPLQINGLVWMGNRQVMQQRLNEKIKEGFRCIKLKLGAINLKDELALLQDARKLMPASKLELRVDANGAFTPDEAKLVLQELERLQVHSIEQPIAAGQPAQMALLCAQTPVPIALDEELIGVVGVEAKRDMLTTIKPQYIILKPGLLGGFAATLEWINLAEELQIGWWITSALEANIGLNAICQFASWLQVTMPQGLGTGSLYRNNIASPLQVKGEFIHYRPGVSWAKW